MNFASVHFEGKHSSSDLSNEGIKLLTEYAALYGKKRTGYTAEQLSEIHRRNGMEVFDLSHFLLKDSRRNQKFRNTLARETLRALSRLHGIEFSHSDIKPPNIVLSQSPNGMVTAKLIDIDFVQDKLNLPARQAGTELYLPPESDSRKISRFSPYDAEKGDGYAMGVSLLEISGHSFADTWLAKLKQDEKAKLTDLENNRSMMQRIVAIQELKVIQAKIQQLTCMSSIRVRDREEISSVTCLKDVADLLMQVPLRNRITPRQAFNLDFFKNENNFLSKKEFSDDARIIVRFCQFVPKPQ